jgi:DNA-binding MarR family transcriptional regulator
MKKMNSANISTSKDKKVDEETFSQVVEAVFLFIHNNYADFSAILKAQKINYSQYAALITIYMYDSLSEGELARLLFLNPSSVSRMVFTLEKNGWLKATRDKADRRKVMVALTPSGKRRMQAMKNMQAGVLTKLVKNLEPEKREYVDGVVDLVNQALRYLTATENQAPVPGASGDATR